MSSPAPTVSLGYVILYVKDVAASLAFYEAAFGFARRFFTEQDGKGYGELETGGTRLAFASVAMAREHIGQDPVPCSLERAPLPVEIAFTTTDVASLFAKAVSLGAVPIASPSEKPWGQVVSYLRDRDGHLIELCTPLP
jgi:uncharacterized glyoxalase superfamily protein PhnB